MDEIKATVVKRAFTYGKGSLAIVVPAQLGFRSGERIKVTFERIEQEVK